MFLLNNIGGVTASRLTVQNRYYSEFFQESSDLNQICRFASDLTACYNKQLWETKMELVFLIDMLTFNFLGHGVFVKQSIEKGSFLVEYCGELISKEEGLIREEKYPLEYGSYLVFHQRLSIVFT